MARTTQIALAVFTAAQLFSAEPEPLRLIEVDPGHSHLSGLHTHMLPGVSEVVHIYSPLSPELAAHLAAITADNERAVDPTHWVVRLFAGPDYLQEMAREKPGAIVALSGRNDSNIRYIEAALRAGQHVFGDKPLVIDAAGFARFEAAIKIARRDHLVVYDWMTLRKETAYRLVRDLVGEKTLFGTPEPGSIAKPTVRLQNLHALLKYSRGVAQRRPAQFMDVRQQGEGMADVGTHLADLAQWTLFPEQPIAYRTDVRMLQADHTALTLTLEQFTRLTGATAWPSYLKDRIVDGKLVDYTNGSCVYTLKGVYINLNVGWQYEAPPGDSDSYFASYQGTRARVELRAGPKEHFVPEIYVTPVGDDAGWDSQLRVAVERLGRAYSGLWFEKAGTSYHLILRKAENGDGLRQIFQEFAGYVRDWATFPEYENSNLLAKYYITTSAVALANAKH